MDTDRRHRPTDDLGVHPCIKERLDAKTLEWTEGQWPSKLGPSLEFFRRFYHEPLARHIDLQACDAAECASGGGLNALAFLLAGGRSIVGYDKTESRVRFANELAERMGLSDRARFEVRSIHALPQEAADVVFSLQTLEHVPRPLAALRALADRTKRILVMSTPNLWWPRDGHDTGLLFAHWAPQHTRKWYAKVRGARIDQFCQFLSPRDIHQTIPEFRRVTKFYNFAGVEDWLAQFPVYFPYGPSGGRYLPDRRRLLKWRLAASMARLAPGVTGDLAPMIEGIYTKR